MCLVSLIETHVECHLNKSYEFVVKTEIIIPDDEPDYSSAQQTHFFQILNLFQ